MTLYGISFSSCSDVGPNDTKLRKIMTFEILGAILEATPVTFSLIKEVMMELMEDRLGSFRVELSLS